MNKEENVEIEKIAEEGEEKVEIAKALKKQGLSIEMIAACTGLSVEEVVKLMTN